MHPISIFSCVGEMSQRICPNVLIHDEAVVVRMFLNLGELRHTKMCLVCVGLGNYYRN